MNNPFDITKAVDFTDDEIVKYWVDISDNNGFRELLLRPSSTMPMIILGSKGSGKTHLMRYFSYELQKIRYKSNIKEGLINDKFIGVYIRCSGFNSERFRGKGQDTEVWENVYSYYWELWIAQILLNIVIDLINNKTVELTKESELINDILSLFNKPLKDTINSLAELNHFFSGLQRIVDYETENCLFNTDRKIHLEILLAPAKITYGLPQLLVKYIPFFKDKLFLYLIDELENFSETQQKLIQTLLREKPASCTFRVGSRLYGVKTYKTLGSNEENRAGSEFTEIVLDKFLRESNSYDNFIKSICINRLKASGIFLGDNDSIETFIEDFDWRQMSVKINKKKESQAKAYFNRLIIKLQERGIKKIEINSIIKNLKFNEDIILERTNLFLFYREWKDRQNLLDASKKIKKEAVKYHASINKDPLSIHGKILEKYKGDIVDMLIREARENIPYVGFSKLTQMSCGTPRNILNVLKYAYNWAFFDNGISPFLDNKKLNIESQTKGVRDTINWFFEDNRIPAYGEGKAVDCMYRLGNWLRELRFADLPPECSINIFGLKLEDLSPIAREVFNYLLNYSYIIPVGERRDKNTNEKTNIYHINWIISPLWELAIPIRGMVKFSPMEAECIFNLNKQDEFDKLLTTKLRKYNAPFSEKDPMPLFQQL